MFLGTIIFTSATKSPLPPFPSLYPFPAIFIFSPLAIPCGTYTVAVSSIEFKFTLVPKAASAGVKYKFVYISVPFNLNSLLS